MNPSGRLITVAIHTHAKAVALKQLLEREGVAVVLQNVNLEHPVISAGVRVRIDENDLPLALRIIENREIFLSADDEVDLTNGMTSALRDGESAPKLGALSILVPVDFSQRSTRVVNLAFSLAGRTGSEITLLHSYMPVAMPSAESNPLRPVLNFNDSDTLVEAETDALVEQEARIGLDALRRRIRADIKSGRLPGGVKFTTSLDSGVPEEAIERAVKELNPSLLVLATRPARQKEQDLLGSVAAEVLDSCRVPALTVPDTATLTALDQVKRVVLLSYLTQEDFLALDALSRLLPAGQSIDLKVVSLPNKKYSLPAGDAAGRALVEYCQHHYPQFSVKLEQGSTSIDDYRTLAEADGVDLLLVPNRKKNVLARLFNPGVAHRILFHLDIPMLVIPV